MFKFFLRSSVFTIFMLFILLGSIVFAQQDDSIYNNSNVKKLSLVECVNIAMESSPLILQSHDEVDIARAKLSEARSGYMPRVNVRASYNYFNTNNVIKTRFSDDLVGVIAEESVMSSLRDVALISGRNPISRSAITELDVLSNLAALNSKTPSQEFDRLLTTAKTSIKDSGKDILWTPLMGTQLFRTELTFQQPLFLWGQVYNKNKQAKEGIGAKKSTTIKTKNDVKFEVNRYYQQVLFAKDAVELASETEQRFETLLEIIDAMVNAGAENVTRLDYYETKTYLNLIRVKIAEAEKALALSRAALKRTIGLEEDVEIDVEENTQTFEFSEVSMDTVLQQAMLNRPEFSELEHGISAKKYEIKATRAENRPKVLLDSALQINVDDKGYLEPDPVDFRLSVIADIPLFDGLRTRAKVNQHKFELNKLNHLKQEVKQSIVLQVTDAVLSFEEAKKKLKATEEAVSSSIENRTLARQGFELEILESEKVIKAQVLEAKAKTEHIMSILNYNVAKANLDRVMGAANEIGTELFIDSIPNDSKINHTNNTLFINEKPESIF